MYVWLFYLGLKRVDPKCSYKMFKFRNEKGIRGFKIVTLQREWDIEYGLYPKKVVQPSLLPYYIYMADYLCYRYFHD